MLVERLIKEIIANFHKQQQLYMQIDDLSGEQLSLLADEKWLDKLEELDELLIKRQIINVEIDALNNHNKSLQGQITTQLALPEFVLSRLEGKLEEEQYKSLREVVAGLGDILAKINKTDEQNHILIKKKAGLGRVDPRANRQQAQNAYHQAVQQGKKS